ncbi:MAG: hypothetical protein IJ404_01520 [Clostridia bacterium]|nr:hypothetical protein [Clostridia bacterium]
MLSDEESPWIFHLCPSTEKGLSYIKEAYSELFRCAPGLSGYINLSVGEPFRLMIKRDGKRSDVLSPDGKVFYRLVVGGFSPDAFCFFVPKM